ncbi:putative cbs domain-containing protein [Teratosphaeria destructans]|uniref:Cbs domain-containing protein n=1 Tax=Teratosphaeria destructans TaxID=418781 RepID=A0A9W7SNW8_9PEZI|nr:putative cbs domain-containing protein [Teratosphaeria destructans]
MAFDEESGLVYKERIVSAPRSRAADYDSSSQAKIAKFKTPSKTGPRSLRESAIRKLLCNLKELDANSLKGLPDAILELLWKRISAAGLDDFRTWRAFAQTPLGGRPFVHTEHVEEGSLRSNLDIFEIAGSSMAWLTTLTLGSRPMSSVELAGVAKVRNEELSADWKYYASRASTYTRAWCIGWRLSRSDSLFKFRKQRESKPNLPFTTPGLFLQGVERLRGLEGSEKLPTLHLALGNARHTTPRDHKTALCFKRDLTVAPCTPKNNHRTGSRAHNGSGRAKKRKIRNGKALALNDILVL